MIFIINNNTILLLIFKMFIEELFLNKYAYFAAFTFMICTNIFVEKMGNNSVAMKLFNGLKLYSIPKLIFITTLLCMMVLGEELIFRIAFPVLLEKYMDNTKIMLLTSLCFSLVHISNGILLEGYSWRERILLLGIQCTRTFILGIYLYFLRNNIFMCFIAHLIFNIGSIMFLVIYEYLKIGGHNSKSNIIFDINNNSSCKFINTRRHSFSTPVNIKPYNTSHSIKFVNINNNNKYYDIITKPFPKLKKI